MKLYIYKTQDMSGDPLMSFNVDKDHNNFNINGLASNTPYWIKMIDDNGFDVVINSGNGCDFSTLDCDEEYPLGYNIVLDSHGFYLYQNKQLVPATNLTYTVNDSQIKTKIQEFPIPNQGYGNYISIYRSDKLLAISEKSTIKN